MTCEPSSAEKMRGDFAPNLVELTDGVLFGDVWERPELSKDLPGRPWPVAKQLQVAIVSY